MYKKKHSVSAWPGKLWLVFLGILAVSTCAMAGNVPTVTNLRCDYRSEPLGVDTAQPSLSWNIDGRKQRGIRQTAYQILVSHSEELLSKDKADLWDSGKVASSESLHHAYQGKTLQSRQQCFWKVRIWDQAGRASAWSQPQRWTMGILSEKEWNGKWIEYNAGPKKNALPAVKKVTASSFAPGYPPQNAVAGDPNKRWVSTGHKPGEGPSKESPAFLLLEYPKVVSAVSLMIDPSRFSSPKDCELQYSNDGKSFEALIRFTMEPKRTVVTFNRTSARFFRLQITSTYPYGRKDAGNVQINELLLSSSKQSSVVSLLLEAAHYMRKDVAISKPVRKATARFACMGFVDLLINGKKSDESVMIATPYTDPEHRVKYVTHDVTDLIKQGDNCIGAVVGNGYNSPPSKAWNHWQLSKGLPRLLLEIEVEFTDGTKTFIGTDESWQNSLGRIIWNDFWVKEIHDLRQEKLGWDLAVFDSSAWENVALANPPKGTLHAARIQPVKRHESVNPIRREGNKYIFDKVHTGFPRITVKGKAGSVVSVRSKDAKKGPVIIDYTLKDDQEVTLEPRFFVHTIGPTFEIHGVDPLPELEDVAIVRVHSDLKKTGEFECSNPLFNELHEIGLQTHLNYTHNYPMDPTREKAGWSQDMQNMFDSASYMTDTANLYEQWWKDFEDTQRADGNVSAVAPINVGYADNVEEPLNDPWWGGMVVYAPWRHYEYYGDKRVLENTYETMKRYLAFLTNQAAGTGGVLKWSGASDWIEVGIPHWGTPKRTSTFLISTMAWYYYATILEQSAEILGKDEDVQTYRALAARIRKTFNEKHFDPETGLYAKATDSQASLIMPLYFGMVPEGKEALVLKKLEDNIHQRDDHLSTGFVSNPYLLHGLTDLGRADLVGKMVNQKDHPSFYSTSRYGVFMETWTAGMAQMPSLGGGCIGWLYRAVLGIRTDLKAPGFKHFIIKPEMMSEVTWAKGSYDSIRGRIVSDWKLNGNTFTLHVEVPANTTATVYLPTTSAGSVKEGGKPVRSVKGVKFLRLENGYALYEVVPGSYDFNSVVQK